MIPNLDDSRAIASALRAHLRHETGQALEISGLRRCSVGFSWITLSFDIEQGGVHDGDYILQIGPPNGLFAPYSVAPQAMVLESLAAGAVPVPKVYWRSDAADVFGAPFFISQRVPGDVLLPWSIQQADPVNARALVQSFVEILARLHAFDWKATPAQGLALDVTAANAGRRQVEAWSRSADRWALRRYPMLDWARQWLLDHAPEAPCVSIVHGDYRIGNFLEREGRITAILDWEMVHMGDPHEDIAWACLPMFNGGARSLFGIAERAEVYAWYEAVTGWKVRPLSVRFYEVLSLYKAVSINLGGVRCSEEGRFNDLRMAAMGTQIAPTLKQLYRTIEAPL